jgi:hypothetical protein
VLIGAVFAASGIVTAGGIGCTCGAVLVVALISSAIAKPAAPVINRAAIREPVRGLRVFIIVLS